MRAGVRNNGAHQPKMRRGIFDRADTLRSAYHAMAALASSPPMPGEQISKAAYAKKQCTRNPYSAAGGLRALGCSNYNTLNAINGVSRRPVLAGGNQTDAVLRSMAGLAHLWEKQSYAWEPDYAD
eukprot:gene11073-6651_t